jgi:hypothetical protein
MKFNEKKDKILEDIRMIPDLPEKKHKHFDIRHKTQPIKTTYDEYKTKILSQAQSDF